MENGKPWLLVVDDSRVVRKTIAKILEPDFHVVEAGDGAAGWRAIANEGRIEAVITDIMMPELDGYHLICKIRAADDAGLRGKPIIAITSAEDDITRERAYACGANDFILKPFNASQLIDCVRTQLADESAAQPTSDPATPNVESIVIADSGAGTVDDALEHIETGLNILRGLKTTTIGPRALALVLRFLPLLKYCNTTFDLGMDREITALQERIAAARAEAEPRKAGDIA